MASLGTGFRSPPRSKSGRNQFHGRVAAAPRPFGSRCHRLSVSASTSTRQWELEPRQARRQERPKTFVGVLLRIFEKRVQSTQANVPRRRLPRALSPVDAFPCQTMSGSMILTADESSARCPSAVGVGCRSERRVWTFFCLGQLTSGGVSPRY